MEFINFSDCLSDEEKDYLKKNFPVTAEEFEVEKKRLKEDEKVEIKSLEEKLENLPLMNMQELFSEYGEDDDWDDLLIEKFPSKYIRCSTIDYLNTMKEESLFYIENIPKLTKLELSLWKRDSELIDKYSEAFDMGLGMYESDSDPLSFWYYKDVYGYVPGWRD